MQLEHEQDFRSCKKKKNFTFEQCSSLAAFATHQKNPHDTKEQFWMLILPTSRSDLQMQHFPTQFYQKVLESQYYYD